MVEHVFGGEWTREKLEKLRAYLVAYRRIFDTNAKAKFFTTWYVDAFAGTGSHSMTSQSSALTLALIDDSDSDEDRGQFLDGSARIALGLASPFDNYLFIEKSKDKADALRSMVESEFPGLAGRIHIRVGDANGEICKWSQARNWGKERAVVFLDPYGMQVEWSTIQTLAATKAVDLWYLFPFITRLLRRDRNLDEAWANRLDVLLGTSDWRSHFYELRKQEGLFGEFESVHRDVTESNIKEFIEQRLKTEFAKVASSHVLRNSKQSPLYALCFAASNEKGATTALKIAQYLLEN